MEATDSGLVSHAEFELKRAGLFDKDSDYDGMIGEAALELVKVFSEQGHSGYSALMTIEVFEKLSRFQPLTPLTNDPTEWMKVSYPNKIFPNAEKIWQSKRNPAVFSKDGGQTWYNIEEDEIDNAHGGVNVIEQEIKEDTFPPK